MICIWFNEYLISIKFSVSLQSMQFRIAGSDWNWGISPFPDFSVYFPFRILISNDNEQTIFQYRFDFIRFLISTPKLAKVNNEYNRAAGRWRTDKSSTKTNKRMAATRERKRKEWKKESRIDQTIEPLSSIQIYHHKNRFIIWWKIVLSHWLQTKNHHGIESSAIQN